MPIYNCPDVILPDHSCDACLADSEYSRVRAVAFIKSSAIAALLPSISDEAAWTAAITAGDIVLIGPVSGTFNGGDPIEAPGFGDNQTRVTGYNNSIVYNDPAYKANCAFYDALQKTSLYYAAFFTGTQVHVSEKTVSVRVQNAVTDSVTDIMQWVATVNWQSTGLTCPADAPVNISPKCAVAA